MHLVEGMYLDSWLAAGVAGVAHTVARQAWRAAYRIVYGLDPRSRETALSLPFSVLAERLQLLKF